MAFVEGESEPGVRLMDTELVLDIQEQRAAAQASFFFKQ
jgi:protein gp37